MCASSPLLSAPPPRRSSLSDWLEKGTVKKLVLVITGVENDEVLERWVFDIQTDEKVVAAG
jgi:hypothetical protein